jgi:hypothetical protein
MSRDGIMTKYETTYVDVDIEIDVEDVKDFIENYATPDDLNTLSRILGQGTSIPTETLIGEMKHQLFVKAFDKYSLEELEERLGMDYM